MLDLAFLIPIFPFVGVLVNGLFMRRAGERPVGIFGSAMIGLSFVFACGAFFQMLGMPAHERHFEIELFSWIAAGRFEAPVAFLIDPLSLIMMLVVTGVSFLIHVYSIGYMHGDGGFRRYFVYLNLFVFFMLLLVMSNNFLLMFVGWEGVGLCSYLLIGFWYTDEAKASAGKKAFIVNRIGDFGFLLAIFLIWTTFGTVHFSKLVPMAGLYGTGAGVITAICLLLFMGAVGKSAQFPLYVWLPDAMAGPTPVSALIHAATMVTAGVYMVVRSNFLFALSPVALDVVAGVGAGTAIFAATIGLVQNDIKKVLAYSTVSQLGFMFLACGVGAYVAAIFHLMTHAFFKGLLFLGSGSVIHGVGGEQDIRHMGGLKEKMPVTYRTFLIATLAIAGVPGLAGFFSKDEILWKTFEGGHHVLWIIGIIAAFCTAFYMFRLLYLTFFGKFRGPKSAEHHLHESPRTMTVPLMVLAVLSVIGGYIGLPHALGGHNWFGQWLDPVIHPVGHGEEPAHHASLSTEYLVMILSVVVALVGIYLAYSWYMKKSAMVKSLGETSLHKLLLNKYWVDQIYDGAISQPLVKGSELTSKHFDLGVIDGLVNGVGAFFTTIGGAVRRVQTGAVPNYLLFMGVGVLALLATFIVAAFQ
ncbi:NADH-quinone oxidoreductase subunit L [bacterium]|nr:NADH-quinone oxidoreductase subunit L [bacterium]MBU1984779.1 NADH-quinone oxidoreductase subunit L [bacterium]